MHFCSISERKIVGVLVLSLCLCACNARKSGPALFEALDSTHTNVRFVNRLPEKEGKLSIVDYLYYYNGAGVAAGDLNKDGLTDLFFISNKQKNKLYLNKGDFRFEDATENAGVGGYADWKTGVTMADVNGDGWLDIYVCAVGDYMGLEGANELYINNGDGTFAEKAADYGLDFTGFSTQSVFFDYDHDGDLDMYLLNHAVHTSRSYNQVLARALPDKSAGDYLYRNDGSKFTDVSKEAGIYQAAMGYGLGVSVADLNNDGWEDMYVSNDFHEDDYYYLNNGDGTFREEGKRAFAHYSRFAMGSDIADVNNDGFQDVMSLDMYPEDEAVEKASVGEDPFDIFLFKLGYGYHYQFSRNCLQINNGGNRFSDVGALAGVAATDWSWSPLLADYDNDGFKDLFVSNGIVKRPNNLDYIRYAQQDSMQHASQLTAHQIRQAISKMPDGKAHNYLYRGRPDLRFEDVSEQWGFNEPSVANGAVYADLDNDGDLDLATNNVNEAAGVYRNRASQSGGNHFLKVQLAGSGKNTFGIGAKVYVKAGGVMQLQQLMTTRGFMSSVEPALLFGLGSSKEADSVVVVWNDGKAQVLTGVAANQRITVKQAEAREEVASLQLYPTPEPAFEDITPAVGPGYRHKENTGYYDFYRESLMPFLVSTEGPKIAVGDVDGDGQEDFFVGGAKQQAGALFLQKERFVPSPQPALQADSVYEDVDALLLDVDNDKDLDLYAVSGGNEFYGQMPQQFDRLYRNDGKGSFTRDTAALPAMFDNKSCVRAADLEGDGDLDLFVGGRVVGYQYGQSPRSYLLLNDGKGKFADRTKALAPGLIAAGMITDARWVDTDGDLDLDLVVAGDWMPLKIFRNDAGKLTPTESILAPDSPVKMLNGLWQCLTAGDFDRDGDVDLVAGNLGWNTKLRKNGEKSVLKMYAGDFDKNQSNDHLLVYNRPDGEFYPVASKDELGKQLPANIHKSFTKYGDFAGKPLDELLEKARLELPEPKTVDQFASVYLENAGNNQFRVKLLPVEAQTTKLFSVTATDVDGDGNLDLLMGGNYAGVGTYQGTYDASYGTWLRGNGKGNFRAVPNHESGWWLYGQVRDIKPIQTGSGLALLVARNNDSVQVLKQRGNKTPAATTVPVSSRQ